MIYLLEILAFFGAFIAFCGMTTCLFVKLNLNEKSRVKSKTLVDQKKSHEESEGHLKVAVSSPIITAKMMDDEKGS